MKTTNFANIIRLLDDVAITPEDALAALCAELDDPQLRREISGIAAHNLQMVQSGTSLGLHRGDLVEDGLKPMTSTHLANGRRGILLLSDFDTAVLGRAFEMREESEIIGFSGRTMVLKIISDGELRLTRFTCEPEREDQKISAGVTFTGQCEHVLTRDSPACVFDAESATYRIDQVSGPVLCLLVSYYCADVSTSLRVNKSTGKVIKVTPSDHAFASAVACLSTLPMLDQELAEAAAMKFVDHPVFYVRWEAIRQLAALKGSASVPIIEDRLADEDSPLVTDGLVRLRDHLAGAVPCQ